MNEEENDNLTDYEQKNKSMNNEQTLSKSLEIKKQGD